LLGASVAGWPRLPDRLPAGWAGECARDARFSNRAPFLEAGVLHPAMRDLLHPLVPDPLVDDRRVIPANSFLRTLRLIVSWKRSP